MTDGLYQLLGDENLEQIEAIVNLISCTSSDSFRKSGLHNTAVEHERKRAKKRSFQVVIT